MVNMDCTFKVRCSHVECREVIYDLQVNCMFGNMYYPTAVTIDNGPYFVLFRDLSFHHVMRIDNINCLLLRSSIYLGELLALFVLGVHRELLAVHPSRQRHGDPEPFDHAPLFPDHFCLAGHQHRITTLDLTHHVRVELDIGADLAREKSEYDTLGIATDYC